jgi:hypothetical protein
MFNCLWPQASVAEHARELASLLTENNSPAQLGFAMREFDARLSIGEYEWVQTSGRGSLKKAPYSGNGWNASARSTQEITVGALGFVEMTAVENNLNRMFGLNHDRPFGNSGYGPIDFAVYLATGVYEIHESGAFKIALGAYSQRDRFRVAVESVAGANKVRYYRNGVMVYQSSVTPTSPLFGDTSFNSSGATVADAVIWSSSVQ